MRKLTYVLLLLTICACSSDPLDLSVVEIEDGQVEAVEFTAIDLPEAPLPKRTELLGTHEDLTLRFAFRASADAKASVRLNNAYAIGLPGLEVEGLTPLREVRLSPGVWQEVELVYQAAASSTPALLSALYLNGNLLYYQEALGTGYANGPLILSTEAGTVDLADVSSSPRAGQSSYLSDEGEEVLNIPQLRYAYYDLEEGISDVRNFGVLTPDKEGFHPVIDLNYLREKPRDYALRFSGDLEIPRRGEYRFWTFSPASARMYIDDILVLDNGGKHGGRSVADSLVLSEGTHSFRLDYVQNTGWNRVEIGYRGPSGAEGRLNTLSGNGKVATPGATTPNELATDDYPYLLRSFVYFPAPRMYATARKRTHAMNVGEGDGPHYTVDLKSGALLQAWRGKFVDIHDMWDGRGEPQVARPLAPALYFDGSPQWALLEDDRSLWPDSLTNFHHQRHELNDGGRPTFFYELAGHELKDRITPTSGGLDRQLEHLSGDRDIYTQIAFARSITETSPGNFSLRGPGATISILENLEGELILQRGSAGDRLLSKMGPGGSLQYSIQW
ncbi:PA14 domain-containing protein [Lewinella sp. W8]|uniref:PA14 domain-containing protein n=1 Tax=Lewinella sp. W8 TaxID=2528208 RepID=UPI0015648DEA|nr:PA14 domain-containing protein [Lewinella sp. W8]